MDVQTRSEIDREGETIIEYRAFNAREGDMCKDNRVIIIN